MLMNRLAHPQISLAAYLLIGSIALFPIFVLTIKGWISFFLLLMSALSIYALHVEPHDVPDHQLSSGRVWLVALIVSFLMPLLAIGLAQAFRQQLIWHDFDGPMRLTLAIPVLLAVAKIKMPISARTALLQFGIPAMLFATLIISLVSPKYWLPDRLTTYFSDPLTFGSMCLSLAIVTLTSIDLFAKDTALMRVIKFALAMAGLYLSIRSGSRTGWFGLPLVLLAIFTVRYYAKLGLIKTGSLLLCILASVLITYATAPAVHNPIDKAFTELVNYQWNSINADNSISMRISILRMAWFYFLENPLGGWGDQGFKHLINTPELLVYASAYTREFPYGAGFHNEIATNMVRSGIWGLISSVAAFMIPLLFFIRQLKKTNAEQRGLGLIGACYVFQTFVSGMTTEVLNLKFTASFYALFVAVIAGAILRLNNTTQQST